MNDNRRDILAIVMLILAALFTLAVCGIAAIAARGAW